MHRWHQVRTYLHHWLYAENEHGLHEPFAFDLFKDVVAANRKSIGNSEIERIRSSYIPLTESVQFQALGAQSTFSERSLKQVALHGGASAHQAKILQDLARKLDCRVIVELGTSLGITSLYLKWEDNVKIFSLEGDPLLVSEARKNVSDNSEIEIIEGNIDDTLPMLLEDLPSIDLLYMDANHRYGPTIDYFEMCRSKLHENSVVVIDDIHWSTEMSMAWQDIKSRPDVGLTMDFYQMGWVFFRAFRQKYHYCLDLR